MEEIPAEAEEIPTVTAMEAISAINLGQEEPIFQVQRKCIKQYAQTVEKNVKYHSNHQENDQSTAEIALPSTDHHDSE